MISDAKQFIFVHIPKTAGNSIQEVLQAYSEDTIITPQAHQDGVERFGVRSQAGRHLNKHSRLHDYKAALADETYRRYFKFATLRNPWDRMVSLYFSAHRGDVAWDREAFVTMVRGEPTLRHYVDEDAVASPSRLAGLLGARRRRGPPAPLGEHVDCLLRYEFLSEDWAELCVRIGIPPTPLNVRNRSTREHYSTYYDDALARIVGDHFAEEIALGGYRLDGPGA